MRERERERARTHAGEKDRGKMLWLLLLYVFSSTWACPMKIGLSQGCCLSYLKFSLWSSDLPLTFLCSIFTGFSLPCLLATAILDSFSLFYLPNTSNHCHSLLLLPSIFPSIRVFSNESIPWMRWPKYWSFSFSVSLFNEYSGLISFRVAWLDLLAVQGSLKSLL